MIEQLRELCSRERLTVFKAALYYLYRGQGHTAQRARELVAESCGCGKTAVQESVTYLRREAKADPYLAAMLAVCESVAENGVTDV